MPGTTATYRNPIIDADYSDPDAVRVGDDASIGANAVVLRDVPAGATAVGIPAKILGPVLEEAAAG